MCLADAAAVVAFVDADVHRNAFDAVTHIAVDADGHGSCLDSVNHIVVDDGHRPMR